MYSEVVFQMPEERFKTVCVVRHVRLVKVFEHIGYGPVKVYIGAPHAVVCISHLSGFFIDGLLLYKLFIVFVPFHQFLEPEELIVMSLYI